MKRLSMSVVAGLLLSMVGAVGAAAELKIGVVSLERLMTDSPQAKAASEALNREFTAKSRDLSNLQASLKAKEEKLTKDRATMSADQISKTEKELRDGNRDLQSKSTELQDDYTARQQEESSKLQESLGAAIQVFAAAQKYDLVLYSGIAYANSALDMTSAVLATLPAVAAAPAKPAVAPVAPAAKAPATK